MKVFELFNFIVESEGVTEEAQVPLSKAKLTCRRI